MCVIDVMIPVWRPDQRLRQSIERLLKQKLPVRSISLVISTDDREDGINEEWLNCLDRVRIQRIPKRSFNHGGTRDMWARNNNADFLLFMTQDAVPVDAHLTEYLADCLQDSGNAVAYARHIPWGNCDEIEKYTRWFNYPPKSERKVKGNRKGIKDCFTSNVCAMYRRDWYEKAGGFEKQILLSEDSVFAGKVMEMGAGVIYCSKAKVLHGHTFSYKTQWKRNFDIGVVHAVYKDVFGERSAGGEGRKLVKGTARHLWKKKKWYLIPRLFILSGVKYLGYQFGKHSAYLPSGFVAAWSLNGERQRRKRDGQ